MNKVELLVPAGSIDAFYAAVKNGADAIYLGGKSFGARVFADNFDHEHMIEVVKYAHLYGVKIYVTMNTMLLEDEIEVAFKEAKFLHEIGVDALIVQDLGLVNLCRQHLPNLELHASTQMHIHNLEGAKFAKSLGLARVVLARETPIEIIDLISHSGIETEVFIHGALCISYSGQCLMSSALQSRSGNRGMCAQCCRLQYKLFDEDEDRTVDLEEEYLLSPKDLNTINELPLIIDSGVASLKIEGRMKRPEYVGLLTRLYREAIDAYYAKKPYKITKEKLDEMKLLFNRGFTSGYAFHSSSHDIFNQVRPNHQGIEIGKVLSYHKHQLTIKLDVSLNQGDGLRIIDGKDEYGIVANKIYVKGLLVNHADKNTIIQIDYPEFINKNALVLKTTDILLNKEINDYPFYRKVSIYVSFKAKLGESFMLKVNDGKHEIEVLSEFKLEAAKKAPVTYQKIVDQLSKTKDTAFEIEHIEGQVDDIFIAISQLNELRRQAYQTLTDIRTNDKKEFIYLENERLESNLYSFKPYCFEVNNIEQLSSLESVREESLIISNDYNFAIKHGLIYREYNINECSKYIEDERIHMASELGGVNKGAMYTYYNLNIANHAAIDMLLKKGAEVILLSSELNDIQIEHLINFYKKNHMPLPPIYLYAYGKRNLMYLKASLVKGLNEGLNPNHHYSLIDTKKRVFKIINHHNIYEIEEDETNLTHTDFKQIGQFFRFTDEKSNEIKTLIKKIKTE